MAQKLLDVIPDLTTHITVNQAYQILTRESIDPVNTLPWRPQGGDFYLFYPSTPSAKMDWRQDGHRWINGGVTSLPKKQPIVKKSYFYIAKSGKESDKGFQKTVYRLADQIAPVLIQYFGDSTLSEDMPHGNSKDDSRPFIPTKQSVIEDLRVKAENKDPNNIYMKETESKAELPINEKA